jgi:hypothetical protein
MTATSRATSNLKELADKPGAIKVVVIAYENDEGKHKDKAAYVDGIQAVRTHLSTNRRADKFLIVVERDAHGHTRLTEINEKSVYVTRVEVYGPKKQNIVIVTDNETEANRLDVRQTCYTLGGMQFYAPNYLEASLHMRGKELVHSQALTLSEAIRDDKVLKNLANSWQDFGAQKQSFPYPVRVTDWQKNSIDNDPDIKIRYLP